MVGIILYAFTGFFVFNLLKYQNLGVANVIWHLFHFLLLFLVGYFFLGEKLTKNQIIEISDRNNIPLKKGMVFSNEPGFYKEKSYGIRIENLVVADRIKFGTKNFIKIDTLP